MSHGSLLGYFREIALDKADELVALAEIHGVPFELLREIEYAVFIAVRVKSLQHERIRLPVKLLIQNFCAIGRVKKFSVTLACRYECKVDAWIPELGTQDIVKNLP